MQILKVRLPLQPLTKASKTNKISTSSEVKILRKQEAPKGVVELLKRSSLTPLGRQKKAREIELNNSDGHVFLLREDRSNGTLVKNELCLGIALRILLWRV